MKREPSKSRSLWFMSRPQFEMGRYQDEDDTRKGWGMSAGRRPHTSTCTVKSKILCVISCIFRVFLVLFFEMIAYVRTIRTYQVQTAISLAETIALVKDPKSLLLMITCRRLLSLRPLLAIPVQVYRRYPPVGYCRNPPRVYFFTCADQT